MRILNVPDMHCMHCVKRIQDALKAEHIDANIDLVSKTVTVFDEKAETVIGILDDLGFDAE
ncbi:MAG: heavy-metal-associated domain-containing protein [Clostridia bacterium]|nr:heavy-metal-associated domain-containing protein [Clostridia bacterium]